MPDGRAVQRLAAGYLGGIKVVGRRHRLRGEGTAERAGSSKPHGRLRCNLYAAHVRRYLAAMPSIRAHCVSVTGITDSRAMRTRGKSLKAVSALISASVTGLGRRLTGATSTAAYFPLASSGSG